MISPFMQENCIEGVFFVSQEIPKDHTTNKAEENTHYERTGKDLQPFRH